MADAPHPISYGNPNLDEYSQELSYAVHHDLGNYTILTLGISKDIRGMNVPDVTFMSYVQWNI